MLRLVIFRSPIIAMLPIIRIGLVSQVATGLIGWTNDAFDLKTDSSVGAVLIVVLFGVGTDYVLFLTFRYRERLRAGEDAKTAMISAVTRAGAGHRRGHHADRRRDLHPSGRVAGRHQGLLALEVVAH